MREASFSFASPGLNRQSWVPPLVGPRRLDSQRRFLEAGVAAGCHLVQLFWLAGAPDLVLVAIGLRHGLGGGKQGSLGVGPELSRSLSDLSDQRVFGHLHIRCRLFVCPDQVVDADPQGGGQAADGAQGRLVPATLDTRDGFVADTSGLGQGSLGEATLGPGLQDTAS